MDANSLRQAPWEPGPWGRYLEQPNTPGRRLLRWLHGPRLPANWHGLWLMPLPWWRVGEDPPGKLDKQQLCQGIGFGTVYRFARFLSPEYFFCSNFTIIIKMRWRMQRTRHLKIRNFPLKTERLSHLINQVIRPLSSPDLFFLKSFACEPVYAGGRSTSRWRWAW